MILYFSATGNDKYVAERIAEKTGDNIVSLRKLVRDKVRDIVINDKENFGIILPCYWGTVPTIFSDYIKKTTLNILGSNHYVYFVTTYGENYGKVGSRMCDMMKNYNLEFDSTYAVKMVDNWNPVFNLTKEYIREAEEVAEREIEVLLPHIINKDKGLYIEDMVSDEKQLFCEKEYNNIRRTDLFKVNKDICIGCSTCSRQCPLDAIKMKNNYPVWVKKKCTLCLGCVHRCPVNAISFNDQTDGHGQYLNKNVKLDN